MRALPPVELEHRDLVVEPRLVVGIAPAHARAPRPPRACASARISRDAGSEAMKRMTRALLVVERVAERRARRLPDGGLARRCRAGSRPRRGRRGGRRPTARRSTPAARRARRCRPRAADRHHALEATRRTPPSARGRAPWRSFSPSRAAAGPTRRRRPPRSRPRGSASPGASSSGSDVPISRWSKSPVACSSIQRHSSSSTIAALARVEHAAGARVDHHERARPDVAAVAPARALDLAVGLERRTRAGAARRRRAVAHALRRARSSRQLAGERLPRCW